MQERLTRLYSKIHDRLPTTRRLEATAHIASWLAVSLTALMIGTAMAAEANPVSAWLIETLGMRGFAVLTPVLVSVAFRLIHRYGDRVIGSVAAGALVLDAVGNVLAVAHVGLPETARWGEFGLTVSVVALVASVAYMRVEVRVRQHHIRQIGRVGLVTLVVSSAFVGGIDFSGYVGSASGVSDSGSTIEDFEGGSNGFGMPTSTTSFEGTYAGESSGSGTQYTFDHSNRNTDTISFAMYAESPDDASEPKIIFEDGNNNYIADIAVAPQETSYAGNVIYADAAANYQNTGIDATAGWVQVEVTEIDYSTETYTLNIYRDGSQVYNNSGLTFSNDDFADPVGGYSHTAIGTRDLATVYFDDITTNAVETASTVNGTVTDQSGNSISNSNITVTNSSGGVVATTTTDNTGDYSVDLTDGNYTIEATADSYDASTQSVEVLGSAVSGVDFSLRDADQQQVEIQVIDYTNQSRFSNPSTLSVATEGSENRLVSATSFNTYNRTSVWLYPREYDFIVTDGETGATYHAVHQISEGQNQLLLQPGLNFSVPELDENESVQVTLNQTNAPSPEEPDDSDSPDVTEETYVTVVSEEPVREFNYTIENDTGAPVYNGTCSGPEPATFCQDQVPDPVPNVSSNNTTDSLTVDYDGEFANGSTFNGTAEFGGFNGGLFGPTGSSDGGGPGSPLVGGALLAGGAVLAYSRFGSRSIPQLLSDVASSTASTVRRLRP